MSRIRSILGASVALATAAFVTGGAVPAPAFATQRLDPTPVTVTVAVASTTVDRPYLSDPVTVTVDPADQVDGWVLQTRRSSTDAWHAAPDTRAVWTTTPGSLQVRAEATRPDLSVVDSDPVIVTVGNGTVPSWLHLVNHYRHVGGAPSVAEDAILDHADALHVRYMEKTGDFSHQEDPSSEWYSAAGAQAGLSSDLSLFDNSPVHGWIEAPFHALALLSPRATLAGYADKVGFAALWVDPRTSVRVQPTYPITFPAAGETTALLSYSGGETPSPVSGCSTGYRSGSPGLPIIASLGVAHHHVTATVTVGGQRIAVCVVTELTYSNSSASAQALGREVLAGRGHAVLVIPEHHLSLHHTYTVTVKAGTHTEAHWGFHTG